MAKVFKIGGKYIKRPKMIYREIDLDEYLTLMAIGFY